MDDNLDHSLCDLRKMRQWSVNYSKIITSVYPTLTWTNTQMQASTDGSVSCPILVTKSSCPLIIPFSLFVLSPKSQINETDTVMSWGIYIGVSDWLISLIKYEIFIIIKHHASLVLLSFAIKLELLYWKLENDSI